MNNLALIILCNFIFFLHTCMLHNKINSDSLEARITRFIENDIRNQSQIHRDSLIFGRTNAIISFQLSSLTEDILSKKYSNNSLLNNANLGTRDQRLRQRIYDSLRSESNKLNSKCPVKYFTDTLNLTKTSYNVCLFFSAHCENQVYVEVVGLSSILPKKSGYEIIGQAKTYLFEVEKEEIKFVYQGSIDYN